MFSVFLSSYRNTRESLGELEKTVETLDRVIIFLITRQSYFKGQY